MKSLLVYKFTCASCSSRYIGETCRHFKTRIEEHIKKDNKSHIFKHLYSAARCFDSFITLCFKKIDKVKSKFGLKTLHINWRKPSLNVQQNHLALPFCYSFCSPCSFLYLFVFLFLLFTFLFHLLFSLSLR